jgi:hypothetical protein
MQPSFNEMACTVLSFLTDASRYSDRITVTGPAFVESGRLVAADFPVRLPVDREGSPSLVESVKRPP